jgi:ACT domain-containing protein
MAIVFPSEPEVNEEFTADDKTWYWDGEKWVFVSTSTGTISATSPITYNSGTQVVGINQSLITIGQSQVTGLSTDLSNIDGEIDSIQNKILEVESIAILGL